MTDDFQKAIDEHRSMSDCFKDIRFMIQIDGLLHHNEYTEALDGLVTLLLEKIKPEFPRHVVNREGRVGLSVGPADLSRTTLPHICVVWASKFGVKVQKNESMVHIKLADPDLVENVIKAIRMVL